MRSEWPKNENIMNWDPENMDKYWELCSRYDQYPQLECSEIDSESGKNFARSSKHPKTQSSRLKQLS